MYHELSFQRWFQVKYSNDVKPTADYHYVLNCNLNLINLRRVLLSGLDKFQRRKQTAISIGCIFRCVTTGVK